MYFFFKNRYMFNSTHPQLLIFELWFNDVLIAADFTHPCCHGLSVYVATRFYDRETVSLKHLQPGFLLALAETKQLRDYGVHLWDLGGVNTCPLMMYKYDLTGIPLSRPQFLSIFKNIRNQYQSNKNIEETAVNVTDGLLVSNTEPRGKSLFNLTNNMVLVDRICVDDLLN